METSSNKPVKRKIFISVHRCKCIFINKVFENSHLYHIHYKTATSSLIPHPLPPLYFPLLKMIISCSDRRKYSFQTLKCQIVLMTPEVLGDERTN